MTETEDFTCEICDATTQVPRDSRYGEWDCSACGQHYRYDEGPVAVLTDEQKKLLREHAQRRDERTGEHHGS